MNKIQMFFIALGTFIIVGLIFKHNEIVWVVLGTFLAVYLTGKISSIKERKDKKWLDKINNEPKDKRNSGDNTKP